MDMSEGIIDGIEQLERSVRHGIARDRADAIASLARVATIASYSHD
jgi:hypothetical protein